MSFSYGSCGQTLTQHQDNARTGADLCQDIPDFANFGLIASLAVDEFVFAQPLTVNNITIGNSNERRNVVFLASMNNTIYAYAQDPNATAGSAPSPLWQTHLGPSFPYVDIATSAGAGNSIRNLGVLGTPVIDAESETIFAVAAVRENGVYQHQLHALSLSDGSQRAGSPAIIQGSLPGNSSDAVNGTISFDSRQHLQRPALLLEQGQIVVLFGSHVDQGPYHGWIITYNANTLQQLSVFSATTQVLGGSFWASGQGPSVNKNGFVYAVAASSPTNDVVANGVQGQSPVVDHVESLLKMSLTPNVTVQDFFVPFNWSEMDNTDVDFGSTGVLSIPDTDLVIAGAKNGILYGLNSNNMGQIQANNPQATQFQVAPDVVWGSPVYWNSSSVGPQMYVWGQSSNLQAFSLANNAFNTTIAQQNPAVTTIQAGGILTIAANGAEDAVLWVNSPLDANGGGVISAFNASNLSQTLWSTEQTSTRDGNFSLAKFNHVTFSNGYAFVPTNDNAVRVYGQLPASSVAIAQSQTGAAPHTQSFSPLLLSFFLLWHLLIKAF